eukprot:5121429-Amphidinium_carterae.1
MVLGSKPSSYQHQCGSGNAYNVAPRSLDAQLVSMPVAPQNCHRWFHADGPVRYSTRVLVDCPGFGRSRWDGCTRNTNDC